MKTHIICVAILQLPLKMCVRLTNKVARHLDIRSQCVCGQGGGDGHFSSAKLLPFL